MIKNEFEKFHTEKQLNSTTYYNSQVKSIFFLFLNNFFLIIKRDLSLTHNNISVRLHNIIIVNIYLINSID